MTADRPRVVVLAGGVGGARFLLGLRRLLQERGVDTAAAVTVVGNVGDDLTILGLRVCPDLDTVMYTLGGGIDAERGWGRADETYAVRTDLAEYDPDATWFTLGDRDVATHLARTRWLDAGLPLSEVTARLCRRWEPGVRLLPASDDRVETHVVCDVDGRRRAVHFQRWWVGLLAGPDPVDVVSVGAADASPAPGVLEALAEADVVLLPPSNPVVSVSTILAVPGVRDALRAGSAPVVGLSPIVGGRALRGMADRLLPAVGADVSAAGVAAYYGARGGGDAGRGGGPGSRHGLGGGPGSRHGLDGGPGDGLLDGWLVDESDADAVAQVEALGVRCRAVPLLMSDEDASAAMAAAALDLADAVRR